MSDKSSPATSHPADHTDEAPSALQALQAVQEALDRRDNGGTADRQAPAGGQADSASR